MAKPRLAAETPGEPAIRRPPPAQRQARFCKTPTPPSAPSPPDRHDLCCQPLSGAPKGKGGGAAVVAVCIKQKAPRQVCSLNAVTEQNASHPLSPGVRCTLGGGRGAVSLWAWLTPRLLVLASRDRFRLPRLECRRRRLSPPRLQHQGQRLWAMEGPACLPASTR